MRGEHVRFVRHAELIERFDGDTHRVPIRFTPHQDGDQRFRLRHTGSLVAHWFAATSFQVAASTAYCNVNAAKSIVLVGMMGAGKSSVGRSLQRQSGLARLDTDEMLATEFGMSIAQIFEKHGEEKFRDAETEVLRKRAPDRPASRVTGGGLALGR